MSYYTITNGGSGYSTTSGNVTISTVSAGGGAGLGGGAGMAYTINTGAGTNGTWTQTYAASNTWDNSTVVLNNKGIEIKEGADLKVAGVSILQTIKNIEDRLAILHPNVELEGKWEQLKDLRRQYEALEKDILEKEKLMKILKEK